MITGVVKSNREATVLLAVRDANGREREVEAILDTGFNGSLTLPSSLITALGLPWRSQTIVMLANGTEDQCDVHSATVIWDGQPRLITIESADTTPLVGMALLYGYRVQIDVVDGGTVLIGTVR